MQRSARLWSSEAWRPASIASTAWLLSETRGRIPFALLQPAHWCSRGRAPASGNLEPTRAVDLPWAFRAGTWPLASVLPSFRLKQTGLVVPSECYVFRSARSLGIRWVSL